MRRSAPGASRRSRSQTQAPGGQELAEGGEALMAPSLAEDRPARSLRRPRERASALQRHLALLLQAAEDGVGDLHPLGIGIVAVGGITSPRSRPGTNAT